MSASESPHFAYLVPERITRRAASLLYAERAVRAAGESVQRELQVLTLTRLWAKQVMGPYVKLTHGGTGRTQ